MTTILVIVAYIFGALSGVACISCTIAGKRMDEVLRMDGDENE